MELIWKELPGEHMIYSGLTQAAVEGDIPLPEGRTLKEVLSCTGSVTLTDAAAKAGAVAVEGRVSVDVICTDGNVFAFSSHASFRHIIPAEGVREGMNAMVQPCLQSLELLNEGGRLYLNAVADMAVMVTAPGGIKVLSSISGVEDAEQETKELTLACKAEVCSGSLRLREELEAPFASAVLYSEACAALRDVTPCANGLTLEGTLYISALVESRTGVLSQLCRAIPFTETVEGSGQSPLWGDVSVAAWDVRASEEFGMVIADVGLNYRIYGRTTASGSAAVDIFSPTLPFECLHSRLKPCSFLGCPTHRHSLTENVMLPEGLPDAQRVIYTAVRPLVTSSGMEGDRLAVEGLLFVRILYAGESGSIFAFNEDIPFSVETNAPGATDALISVRASASASGGGRSVELSCTVLLTACLYGAEYVTAVCGIEECPPRETSHGLMAYFPSSGETLYSVAKKYNTSRSNLRHCDPNLPEVLTGKERIVFMC